MLDSARKVYKFIANKCHKWYQLFHLSPLLAETIKGKMYQETFTATFNQIWSVSTCNPKRCIFCKIDFCQSLSQKSYFSSMSVWRVWISKTKCVAHRGILTEESLCFNRKIFWSIFWIDEKPSRRIWLSKQWSPILGIGVCRVWCSMTRSEYWQVKSQFSVSCSSKLPCDFL